MINETFCIFASLKKIETTNKVQTIKTANIMKTTNETRRQVCEMMHKLMAQGITTKSEAMYLAWANVKLANALKESIVEFTYFKIDGTVRVAHGTLRGDIIPQTQRTANGTTNYNVQTYFDTDKNAWRCCKRVNLCY